MNHQVKPPLQPEIFEPNTVSAGLCPVCGCDHFVEWLKAPDRFHGRHKLYSLIRCPSCSLVRLQDPPPPSEIAEHYGARYDGAISSPGDDPGHWRERREALLRVKPGGALLDLGCSSGGFLAAMKGPSWKLFGVEVSEPVAKRAQDRCGAEVFVGAISDAPFPPDSFDAITCFHVFEHLYEPREVLARISEWLKPGGVFYTMMPNIDSAGARIFGSYWYALELPRHLYHFSPASLRALADRVGLEVVSLTTNREVFIEQSMRYVFDAICRKAGYSRPPLSDARTPSIAWRVIRKAFRLTILPCLTWLASFAGDGESIHAILRKDLDGSLDVCL
ncbi:MAG: class I SAM-dependent methyltransferase [Bryobacteraceae bacterium]|jgi:SAM-dependent methyltransferase